MKVDKIFAMKKKVNNCSSICNTIVLDFGHISSLLDFGHISSQHLVLVFLGLGVLVLILVLGLGRCRQR